MQCRPTVSGFRGGKVHRVANTKLRPKPDRILPLQVPSAYLLKPRKRPANTYLKTLPPVPPIITQFGFSLEKDMERCLLSRLCYHQSTLPSLMRIAITLVEKSTRRNSKRGNYYKKHDIFSRSRYEIFLR